MQSSSPAQTTAVLPAEDSSGASPPTATFPEELACRNQPAGSYQQISCLDSVIRYRHLPSPYSMVSCWPGSGPLCEAVCDPPHRYLEGCSEATTLKRKCEFPLNASTQKASDKRKATGSPRPPPAGILFGLLNPPGEIRHH